MHNSLSDWLLNFSCALVAESWQCSKCIVANTIRNGQQFSTNFSFGHQYISDDNDKYYTFYKSQSQWFRQFRFASFANGASAATAEFANSIAKLYIVPTASQCPSIGHFTSKSNFSGCGPSNQSIEVASKASIIYEYLLFICGNPQEMQNSATADDANVVLLNYSS